jgi:hypothetical protein
MERSLRRNRRLIGTNELFREQVKGFVKIRYPIVRISGGIVKYRGYHTILQSDVRTVVKKTMHLHLLRNLPIWKLSHLSLWID